MIWSKSQSCASRSKAEILSVSYPAGIALGQQLVRPPTGFQFHQRSRIHGHRDEGANAAPSTRRPWDRRQTRPQLTRIASWGRESGTLNPCTHPVVEPPFMHRKLAAASMPVHRRAHLPSGLGGDELAGCWLGDGEECVERWQPSRAGGTASTQWSMASSRSGNGDEAEGWCSRRATSSKG